MVCKAYRLSASFFLAFLGACDQAYLENLETAEEDPEIPADVMPTLGGISGGNVPATSSSSRIVTDESAARTDDTLLTTYRDEDIVRVEKVRGDHNVSISAQHVSGDDLTSKVGYKLDDELAFGHDGVVTLTVINDDSGELITAQTVRAVTPEPLAVRLSETTTGEVLITMEDPNAPVTYQVSVTLIKEDGKETIEEAAISVKDGVTTVQSKNENSERIIQLALQRVDGTLAVATRAFIDDVLLVQVGATTMLPTLLATDDVALASHAEIDALAASRNTLRAERKATHAVDLTEKIAAAADKLKTLRTALAAQISAWKDDVKKLRSATSAN